MKMTNRSGSNTDPCGMPDVTSFHSELFPFIITFYFRGSNTDPCGMPDVTSFYSELFPFIITFYFLSAR
jgi:hypothetical protein